MMKLSATRTKTLSRLGLRRRYIFDLPLVAALLVALALRLLLWGRIPRTGLISDEGEYLSAASWLAHGHGFDWYQGYLWTRAPLYPLFLAAHLRAFGDSLASINVTQTLLSLINVALVYFLAHYLIADHQPPTTDRRPTITEDEATHHTQTVSAFCVPGLAALLMALYFPFALYAQTLLSETLFITLLLGGFLALARWTTHDRRRTTDERDHAGGSRVFGPHMWLAGAGVLFGLATLTRSITLLFLPVVALWVLVQRPAPSGSAPTPPAQGLTRNRFLAALVFLACAGTMLLPWTVYNSRIYHGLVLVDTSGAFNLLLGGRTAYDGKRQDAPPRNFVLALLDDRLTLDARRALVADACLTRRDDQRLRDALARPASAITQAERQQLMTAEGLCLIGARPLAFLTKSLAELADLFQINYSGDERFADGYTTGRLPPWYALSLFLFDDTLYILILPLAVIGWALSRRQLRIADTTLPREGRNTRQSTICNLQSAIGTWWLYNILLAPLLFAINRFRLPLLPFAFIFAAYALVALRRGQWAALRSRRGLAWALLALALALVATTPYTYLGLRAGATDQQTLAPSYLGPDPSSLASTQRAITSRPRYLATEQLRLALQTGDLVAADTIVSSDALDPRMATLGRALLAGRRGRFDEGLRILPADDALVTDRLYRVLVGVVRGDLLRGKGDRNGARAIFTQRVIDDANPAQWAWDWLHPVPLPTNHIDLAGNLDLGYIAGCYLGEGDASQQPPANFRWCTDGAQLRFPGAGTGAPQMLALRADGRGWLAGWLPVSPVRVQLGDHDAGAFTPSHDDVQIFTVALPASPPGADVVVTLRTPTFIPDAARYLSQQGDQVGQVQRLGVRLDWAELRGMQ
jgi:hypothetical protein